MNLIVFHKHENGDVSVAGSWPSETSFTLDKEGNIVLPAAGDVEMNGDIVRVATSPETGIYRIYRREESNQRVLAELLRIEENIR